MGYDGVCPTAAMCPSSWVCSKASFCVNPPVRHTQSRRVVDADVKIGHAQRGFRHAQRGFPITDEVGPTLVMFDDVPKHLLLGMLKMRSSLRIREMVIPFEV